MSMKDQTRALWPHVVVKRAGGRFSGYPGTTQDQHVPKAPGLRQYISLRVGITVPKGRTNNLLTPGVQSVEKI